MAKVVPDRLIELIRLSRTVDDSDVEKVLSTVSEEVRSSSEKLAQHFIAAGLLTQWQRTTC